MAHQGGKLPTYEERSAMYQWLYDMEFGKMGLPEPDIKLFLHMPTAYTTILKTGRSESLDENEKDLSHLKNAERAYLEVANIYGFDSIECIRDEEETPTRENIKTPDEISEEVYKKVKTKLV